MILTPRSDYMAKHFFAKLFLCEQKKRGGPACNAGAFLATSLGTQRSSIKKVTVKSESAISNPYRHSQVRVTLVQNNAEAKNYFRISIFKTK